jgi:hypothetical protein
MDLISGKLKMEQLTADQINQEAEIKALFRPEQLAAYPEYQQAEKLAAADSSAKSDAGRIADDFNLTKEQQEQIRAAFYQMNLNEPDKALNEEAIAAAKRSGNYADSVNMGVELQKAQLEEKIKILGNILTPKQINSYREEQLNQINLGASAIKMFFPKNAAGTTN